MKKIICTMSLIVGLVAAVWAPTPGTAACDCGTVTGAARATFAAGATYGSVALKTLELGTGVFIEPDGTANGVYSAVLTGKSLLGQTQQITIEGKVLHGEVAPDGRIYFNGIATINLGNGTPSLSGVPFSVSTTGESVGLSIDSTAFPDAQLASGNITIN
jgi:hypothetical protein